LTNELNIDSAESLNKFDPENAAAKIHDKDTTTSYISLKHSQNPKKNPWVEVNLNAEVAIGFVKMVNRLDCPNAGCKTRLENTKVETFRATGYPLKVCGIVVGVRGHNVGEIKAADETYYVDCRGVPARKIRLTDVDNVPNVMNIAEVQVFGVEKGWRVEFLKFLRNLETLSVYGSYFCINELLVEYH
jgi:hypothetical protein